MRSKALIALSGAVAIVGLLSAAAPAFAQGKTITVWFGKGFYKSEDDALFAAVKKFEDKAKVKVDISQYPPQDMIPKTVAAMDSATPPDVAYGDVFDFQVVGKWAFHVHRSSGRSRHRATTRWRAPDRRSSSCPTGCDGRSEHRGQRRLPHRGRTG